MLPILGFLLEVRLYGSKRTSLAFENSLAKVLVRSIPGIQRKDKGSASAKELDKKLVKKQSEKEGFPDKEG